MVIYFPSVEYRLDEPLLERCDRHGCYIVTLIGWLTKVKIGREDVVIQYHYSAPKVNQVYGVDVFGKERGILKSD